MYVVAISYFFNVRKDKKSVFIIGLTWTDWVCRSLLFLLSGLLGQTGYVVAIFYFLYVSAYCCTKNQSCSLSHESLVLEHPAYVLQ